MGGPVDWTIPVQYEIYPRQDKKWDQTLGTICEAARSGARRTRPTNRMEGQETL